MYDLIPTSLPPNELMFDILFLLLIFQEACSYVGTGIWRIDQFHNKLCMCRDNLIFRMYMMKGRNDSKKHYSIALFTVNFSLLHSNMIQYVCEAILNNFIYLVDSAKNSLVSVLGYTVMQMRIKANHEKD